jgi:hypothetical protein
MNIINHTKFIFYKVTSTPAKVISAIYKEWDDILLAVIVSPAFMFYLFLFYAHQMNAARQLNRDT